MPARPEPGHLAPRVAERPGITSRKSPSRCRSFADRGATKKAGLSRATPSACRQPARKSPVADDGAHLIPGGADARVRKELVADVPVIGERPGVTRRRTGRRHQGARDAAIPAPSSSVLILIRLTNPLALRRPSPATGSREISAGHGQFGDRAWSTPATKFRRWPSGQIAWKNSSRTIRPSATW